MARRSLIISQIGNPELLCRHHLVATCSMTSTLVGSCTHKTRKKNKNSTTITKICMGSIRCTNEKCKHYQKDRRPRSTKALIEKQLSEGCTTCKQQTLEHIHCNGRVSFAVAATEVTLWAKQSHCHGPYKQIHVPAQYEMEVAKRILEFPQDTADSLLCGTSKSRPQYPARPLNQVFLQYTQKQADGFTEPDTQSDDILNNVCQAL